MSVVWVVDVGDDQGTRRLRFDTEEQAIACCAAAVHAGFAAVAERVMTRHPVTVPRETDERTTVTS